MKNPNLEVTKEQQIKELTNRVTPILNIDIIVLKDGKYLVGYKLFEKILLKNGKRVGRAQHQGCWLFPGGRMKYTETPQETAVRILNDELPGVKAQFKKLITVLSDKGWDLRAYGITIYYLFEYESGTPESNEQLNKFRWLSREEFLNSKDV